MVLLINVLLVGKEGLKKMSDEYALHITNQAVARACLAMDIKTSYSNVISVLSDVAKGYAKSVSRNALDIAEHSGRYTIGTQDVMAALEQSVRTNFGLIETKIRRSFSRKISSHPTNNILLSI